MTRPVVRRKPDSPSSSFLIARDELLVEPTTCLDGESIFGGLMIDVANADERQFSVRGIGAFIVSTSTFRRSCLIFPCAPRQTAALVDHEEAEIAELNVFRQQAMRRMASTLPAVRSDSASSVVLGRNGAMSIALGIPAFFSVFWCWKAAPGRRENATTCRPSPLESGIAWASVLLHRRRRRADVHRRRRFHVV